MEFRSDPIKKFAGRMLCESDNIDNVDDADNVSFMDAVIRDFADTNINKMKLQSPPGIVDKIWVHPI